ncbi:hypothetical protein [Sulfitobacter sp. 20_GPM-1509m]|uniref:hypothetical protein n=1 Tax=Sulfitobacter sp. 20_GPM-1509m TaxID=1380367 RepID=UPI000490FD26|nr:hypothetical protein [Sulfitobacter sp. 20_GPM-1509m]
MALNPSIILAGTQPNLLAAVQGGNQAAAQQNEFQRTNALNNLYKEQGAQIASGDQNALNALAQFDPKAALGIQGQRQSMEINREELAIRRQSAARQAEAWAQQQDERTRAEQAAKIKQGLMAAGQAYQAGDQAAFDRILQESGAEPFPMEEFPFRAAQYEGVLDALDKASKFGQGPQPEYAFDNGQFYDKNNPQAGAQTIPGYQTEATGPLSTAGKLAADLRAGRITQEEYNAAVAKSGLRVSVGPDGNTVFEQGVGVTGGGKPPSERQSTLRLFGGLMDETMPAINQMEDSGQFDPTSVRSALADGGRLANAATTPEARRYEALKRQWAEGVLRIQTGAAATEPEINRVLSTYFPRFGDDPQTVAQKRAQRDAFARSLVPASGGTMQAPGGASDRPDLQGAAPSNGPQASEPSAPTTYEFKDDATRSVFEKYSQPQR